MNRLITVDKELMTWGACVENSCENPIHFISYDFIEKQIIYKHPKDHLGKPGL